MDYFGIGVNKFICPDECNYEEEKINEIVYDESGNIYGVRVDDELIQYNSAYDTEKLISVWCSQNDISNYMSIAIVFGLADGRYVKKLREINKEMLIIVFEPSVKLAMKMKKEGIIEELCNEKNTLIISGKENYTYFYQSVGTTIGYETSKYVRFYVSPNYDRIYMEEIRYIIRIIKEQQNLVNFNRNTILVSKEKINNNITSNLVDCVEQKSLANLISVFDRIDKTNIPAIVVAAGPSLDKNISELKNAKGKAFIIAVDTALNALAKVDILPDIAITVDPIKAVILFSNERMTNIPLVYALSANSEIRDVHKGIRIYHDAGDSLLNVFYDKFNKKRVELETGGSVANDAYSLAQKLGFKTVIFVGQDLAYPNDKEHSDDSYGDTRNNYITNNGKTYFYVEDIYGGKVKTEYNMNAYRLWFERAVQVYSDIRYIDATEGGAKKAGMEIATLKDAIAENCISDEFIDFSKIINETENTFSEDEKKEIYQYIANYDREVSKIKNKIRSGITYYEKLSDYNNKQLYGKGFRNTYNKIKEINDWLTNSEETRYLTLYVAEKDYEIKETVYSDKDNTFEEIKFMVDKGVQLLNAYLVALDDVVKLIKPVEDKAKELMYRIK